MLDTYAPHSVLRVTFANGVSICAPRPSAIRVQRHDDGRESALEAETEDGAFLRVAFRTTALPEQVDGIAPGEVVEELSLTPQD